MKCHADQNDPRVWVDVLTFDGRRLRTECRHCEKFIGYRVAPKPNKTKTFSQRKER